MPRKTLLSLALIAALAACTPRGEPQASADDTAAATAPTADAGTHAFKDGLDEADFAEHVRQLASDAFAGRGPIGKHPCPTNP